MPKASNPHFVNALFEKHGLKKEESVMVGKDRSLDAGEESAGDNE